MLALSVSVWVVGCTITHESAPTLPPTVSPQVTLTPREVSQSTPPAVTLIAIAPTPEPDPTALFYTVQHGDTLLEISRRFGVAVDTLRSANAGLDPAGLLAGSQIVIPNPRFDSTGLPILPTPLPPALSLTPPTCYPTATDVILCLGQLMNKQDTTLGRVSVGVRLARRDGAVLAEGAAGIEQAIILPGRTAPYRLLVRADWRDFAGAAAWLWSADPAADAGRYLPVAVENEHGWPDGDEYVVSALLHNRTGEAARLVRAVVTLQDDKGQVTGYRVLRLNTTLAAGSALSLEVRAVPQARTRTTAHTLYVEAERQG